MSSPSFAADHPRRHMRHRSRQGSSDLYRRARSGSDDREPRSERQRKHDPRRLIGVSRDRQDLVSEQLTSTSTDAADRQLPASEATKAPDPPGRSDHGQRRMRALRPRHPASPAGSGNVFGFVWLVGEADLASEQVIDELLACGPVDARAGTGQAGETVEAGPYHHGHPFRVAVTSDSSLLAARDPTGERSERFGARGHLGAVGVTPIAEQQGVATRLRFRPSEVAEAAATQRTGRVATFRRWSRSITDGASRCTEPSCGRAVSGQVVTPTSSPVGRRRRHPDTQGPAHRPRRHRVVHLQPRSHRTPTTGPEPARHPRQPLQPRHVRAARSRSRSAQSAPDCGATATFSPRRGVP